MGISTAAGPVLNTGATSLRHDLILMILTWAELGFALSTPAANQGDFHLQGLRVHKAEY
jgi:hypothetical protein